MNEKEREYFHEYFIKMAEIQAELENGDAAYTGGYKSIHAGQALLYDMAASAAVKADAAKNQADKNHLKIKDLGKYIKWLATAVGILVLINLPAILVWLETNWSKIF